MYVCIAYVDKFTTLMYLSFRSISEANAPKYSFMNLANSSVKI